MAVNRNKAETGKALAVLRPVAWGCALALAVLAALLLLLALLMTLRDFPSQLIDPLTVTAAALSCFAGGYVSARRAREKGMLLGMICAGTLFAAMYLCSLPIEGAAVSFFTAVKLLSMLLAGAVGGVIGVNRRVRH